MPKRGVITAKDSLKYTPLGPFMIFSGSVFLDRGNNKRAVESLTKAAERVRNEKLSIWLFPEGTRTLSKEPNVLPLKKGGFHLAIQSGAPIVPIVTENYWNLYRPGIFRSGTIRVKGARQSSSSFATSHTLDHHYQRLLLLFFINSHSGF